MEVICKNCEVNIEPEYDFCPKCSQKTKLHRLGLHEVLHEALHYFTHADKGLFTLIRDLFVKRGVVAREFVEGKRKKYFSPLNFFLLVAALNLFAINANETYVMPDILKEHPELLKLGESQRQFMVHAYEKQHKAVFFIKKSSNITPVMMLPIMAFVFWLFYFRKKYNYTEHLVAAMYMYGFCTFIYAVLVLLNLIVKIDDNYLYGLMFLIQIVYFANFYYGFFENKMRFRGYIATVSAIVFLFVINGIAVGIYMFGPFE